jgi:hypothetical protein
VKGGPGARRKAALAGLAALAAAAALAASPAQGATYAASIQMPEGPLRAGSVSGLGREVSITAVAARPMMPFITYSGPGRTSPRGVFGRLGQFGVVRLGFEPDGKPKRIRRPRGCTGGPRFWLQWGGTFSGSVRFNPEPGLRGYDRSGSFEGLLQTVPRWHCRQLEPVPHFDPDAGGVDVLAYNCDARSFSANVEIEPADPPSPDEGPTPARFSASWTKSVGSAKVRYSISVEGGPQTAVFADDLSEGTIRPPPPFHGEATILKQGDDWTWSGSLTARFPGRTVRLTGPGFEPTVQTFKPRPYTSYFFTYAVRC